MKIWKKCMPFCGLLPAIGMGLCMLFALHDYQAPLLTLDAANEVQESQSQEESSIGTEQLESQNQKKQSETASVTSSEKSTTSAAAVEVQAIVEASSYQDGVYTGTGTGFRGTITVQVTISNGKITGIIVLDSMDDEPYFTNASALLQTIISQQSTNVDTVSGATYSSAGLIEAVRNALSKAAGNNVVEAESVTQEATTTASIAVAIQLTHTVSTGEETQEGSFPYQDGTYTGVGEGYRGDVTVAVTIQNGYLTAIKVVDTEDDEPYFTNASALLQTMLDTQKIDVDVVSGATFSSEGILSAVADALANATPKATTATTAGVTTLAQTTTTTAKAEIVETTVPDDETTTTTTTTTEVIMPAYQDGIYEGTAICEPDDSEDFTAYTLTVKVTIENGVITAITDAVGSGTAYDSENDWYISRALNGTSKYAGVSAQILESAATSDIDAVSGATCSSNALVEAVEDALEQALGT